ncbi:hypothetical protein GcM3_206023b [Golovinomyces cichoracearum]|uniref:Tf2-1-like SH3-like domain-containing protein n=1 Tax=Golovinomyces cichoracearum TaxID=62708 RepID=A0A420HBT2_9PEZI|nr:hypothetical protein GcM3_206023b [Golovinomyces cichoracearum]
MQKIIENLQINASLMQQQQAKYSNTHRSDAPLYKVGDMVYVDTRNWNTDRPTKKLDDKYAGPWKVTRVVPGSRAVEVDLPSELKSEGIFNVFHPQLLRLYIPDPVPLQKPPEPKPIKIEKIGKNV